MQCVGSSNTHRMWPTEDSWSLYVAPSYGNAIAWSEDNLLAVASGAGVLICSPSDLGGELIALYVTSRIQALMLMQGQL